MLFCMIDLGIRGRSSSQAPIGQLLLSIMDPVTTQNITRNNPLALPILYERPVIMSLGTSSYIKVLIVCF